MWLYPVSLLLSSSIYFIFLAAIFFVYWPLSEVSARFVPFYGAGLAVILFANYFFYARWDFYYLILIPIASTCDYFIGLGLQGFQRSSRYARRAGEWRRASS